MKFYLSLLLAASPLLIFCQSEQKIPLQGATAVHFYAEVSGLYITTASTDEISVRHIVQVNGEDRPDLQELDIVRDGNELKILERKPNIKVFKEALGDDNLNITHKRDKLGDGSWGRCSVVSYLEITVPKKMKVTAETLYGGIEAMAMENMPRAKSTYGTIEVVFSPTATVNGLDFESTYQSVDVTLPAATKADLQLRTSYGSMYTDFEFPMKANMNDSHSHEGRGQPLNGVMNGGGKAITLSATYKNIYLRKH
ncbi:MAG: hypothetical protein AAF840_01045 [Bacteroidota bacterium]